MERKINFNAGPATLPAEVLAEAAEAVKSYERTGLSILELPHRSKEFKAIVSEANELVKELCCLNDDYEVVWLQGGGRMQFCMVPMNFLPENGSAGYIDSGRWAEEALEYATHYGDVQILTSAKSTGYSRLPEWPAHIPTQLAYVHYTTNNTIYGTQWHLVPQVAVPLIADMSSDIFAMQHDYTRYAMFYAAVQKNLGTPGTALAVIRRDMLERDVRPLPPMLSYKAHVAEHSVLNTANVFGIYVSLLMLRWTKARGMAAIEKENRQKARLLYDAIDNSQHLKAHVTEPGHRSITNVCFTARTPEIEQALKTACERAGITGIEGHRFVGGFRVSLFNAIGLADVQKLLGIMGDLEKK